MRPQTAGYRPVLLLFFLCMIAAGVSAWTVEDMAVQPAGKAVSPGTTITVSCTVHFDTETSEAGRTFVGGHMLDMSTELDNAKWTATLINIDTDRDPIITQLSSRTGMRYRIDGWTLSYDDAELDLVVTLRGTVPQVTAPQEKTVIRIEELDSGAVEVPGALTVVRYQVAFPTTAITTARTLSPVSTATTATQAPVPTAIPATLTVKQTYSPGPDPVLVTGILVIAAVFVRRTGERRSP